MGEILEINHESLRIAAYLGFWSMVLLAIIMFKTTVDVDVTDSPLVRTFGYNNICINWDYSPSREIVALFYPVVEYPLIAYIFLTYLQYRSSALEGKTPMWFHRLSQVLMAVQLVLFAWFRMIFVIDPSKNLVGHSLGFLGLEVGLLINNIHETIYAILVDFDLGIIRGLEWTRLSLLHTRILLWAYVAMLVIVTVTKVTIALSIFNGSPVVDVHTASGASFAKAMDIVWMVLAAVMPLPIAILKRREVPALRFDTSLVNKASGAKENNYGVDKDATPHEQSDLLRAPPTA